MFHNTGVITDDPGRGAVDRASLKKEFGFTPYPFFASRHAFRTPTLRNVEMTAPYFHNGSVPTLKAAIEFYNVGGENPDKSGLARGIKPLNLSEQEINDMVAFIKALTSPPIVIEAPQIP